MFFLVFSVMNVGAIPTVTINQPADSTWYKTLTNITGTAWDSASVNRVNISIYNSTDNTYWTGSEWQVLSSFNLTTIGTTEWYNNTLPIWTNGTIYIVNATAVNTTGGISNNDTHKFYYYNESQAPTSSVDEITTYWNSLSDNPLSIAGTANDGESGLKNVTLYYYNSTDNATWSGPWTFDVNSTPWTGISWSFTFPNSTGYYRFYSIAIDNVSNAEAFSTNDTFCGYDVNDVTVTITNPVDGSWYNTALQFENITGACSDSLSGISSVYVSIYNATDGEYWNGTSNEWGVDVNVLPATLNGTWTGWWLDTSGIGVSWENGTEYWIIAVAFDNVSNNDTALVGFGYDGFAPWALITLPEDNGYYTSLTTINGTSGDSFSGIQTVNITIYNTTSGFYWNGTDWALGVNWSNAIGYGSWIYDAANVTWFNGSSYIINASVKDNASNIGTPLVNHSFIFDIYGPVISSISPGTPSTTSATITWTTNENATSNLEYGPTNAYGTWSNSSTYTTSHSRPLTGLSASTTYYYRVLSYDRAGNPNASLGGTGTFTTASEGGGGYIPPSSNLPTARTSGPYTGTVGTAVQFDGSTSTAVSGRTISSYSWSFGDGVSGTGARPTHIYSIAGTYTVTLTVTDNQGSSGSTQTTATISASSTSQPSETISNETMDEINTDYGIELEEPFYASDVDGDGVVDTFTDPNGILTNVNYVNISGHASFLLSTNEDNIPEFFWDTTTNTITQVTNPTAQIAEPVVDKTEETITIEITVDKADWIYIDTTDQYPYYALTIKTSDGRTISTDKIWRENGKIYVLDDPDTMYDFVYAYTILSPTFDPITGTTFDTSKPTITITYQEEVDITAALFGNSNILSQITTTDHMTFAFVAGSNIADGTYTLSITAEDSDGNTLVSTASYTIQTETLVTPTGEFPWTTAIIGIVIVIAIILILIAALFKTGYLVIEAEPVEETKKESAKNSTTPSKKK